MNDVLRQMAAHRSVRRFKSTPVPDEHIEHAVEAAQMAATSSWIQAYSLLQVRDAGERRSLRQLTGDQEQVESAGAFFAICADVRRHKLVAKRADKPYVANLEVFLLAVIDATLFAQNLNLAFESLGYGTCYIGGLRTRLPDVDTLLEIPHGVFPLFGLCVGEAADDPATRPRFDARTIWQKDRIESVEEQLAHIDDFDALAAEHYAARGLDGRNWSSGLWRKFQKPLREHLAGYYASKGASLD